MYESLGSQFVRTPNGIELGPDAFDKSRFNFRLVLEGKTGKRILESSKLELLEKFLAINIALSDAENNTSTLLNR